MPGDFRIAARLLLKSPFYTAAAVFILGLAIAGNTAIFSAANALLLGPLPYTDADRLLVLSSIQRGTGARAGVSCPDLQDWTRDPTVFEHAAAVQLEQGFNIAGIDEPVRVSGGRMTAALLPVLGMKPQRGRGFLQEDERSGAPAVVLITDRFWQSAFRRSEDTVGRDIVIDSVHATIVGVLPPDFRLLYSGYSIWMPVRTDSSPANRRDRSLLGIARLRPGVTTTQAAAMVSSVSARLEHDYPDANRGWRARILPMRDFLLAGRGHTLLFLMTALGLLLLVACANVASLQLARATARQGEIAIRLALGASRGRIVRFLLVEAGLVAAASGALGLLLVAVARAVLLANSPELRELTIDARVLGFTFALTGTTAVVFGLMPALTSTRVELAAAVKGQAAAQRATRRLRSAMVVAELSLSLVLLVPAGLLFKSFLALRQTEPGFRADNVLTFSVAMPAARYSSDPQRRAFSTEALRQLAEIPGVISVSASDGLPLDSPASVELGIPIAGRRDAGAAGTRIQRAGMRSVAPAYFRTFDISIQNGRAFDGSDGPDSPAVAVVNETLAKMIRSDRQVSGERVDAPGLHGITIVGVVADTRSVGLRTAPQPEIFVPLQQRPRPAVAFALATAGDPTPYIPEVRARMRALDRDLPLAYVRPMTEIIEEQTVALRVIAMFLGGLALLALLLAAAGLSGIMSWLVTLRTHEIGVRAALGASRRDVLMLIMRDALVLAAAGVGLGLPAAALVARLVSSSLWGVSATDASVFLLVPGILIAVALLAGYGPALRAARLDPAVVLRGM